MINLGTAKHEDRIGIGWGQRKQMASAHVITEEFLSHLGAAVHKCCSPITANPISIYILN